MAPEDYYQKTKYLGEDVVRSRADGAIEYTILRPTAIYGPGDPARFLMIFRRVNRGRFLMFGSGQTYYHPVYIDNLVDAFELTMAPGAGAGEAYIIADEEYLPIRTLVEKVGKALDVELSIPTLPIAPLIVAGHICEKVCKPFGINPPIFPRRVDWFRQVRAFKIDPLICMLFALTGLVSCASAPPPLVETQIRDVDVTVRAKLPDKCFKDHQPPQPFSSEGRLPVGQLDDWAEGLAITLEKEWATNAECRMLNEQRGQPSELPADST